MPLATNLLGYAAGDPRPRVWAENAPSKSSPKTFLQAATLVARQLCGEHQHASGLVFWPADGLQDEWDRQTDLFHGPPGIALFLAAFAMLTGEADCRKLAIEGLEGSRRAALDRLTSTDASWQIGGLTGLGSVAYALHRAGEFLEDHRLKDQAVDLFLRLDRDVIHEDRRFDVTFGTAGTLLVALALRRRSSSDSRNTRLLEIALDCGRHLLGHRVAYRGLRAWRVRPDVSPSSGFAHGASGIGVALARLAAASGESGLWAAAREAFAFEALLFSPELQNWWGEPGDTTHPIGWCYGAAGIALARLAARQSLDLARRDGVLGSELETALATCWSGPRPLLDHLCCGSLCRAEALLVASLECDAGQDRKAAETIGSFVLRATKAEGRFRVSSASGHEPSFFHGLAGIGYTFLRLATPERLPSVLRLD